ncbi:hypothetical protein OAP51_06995 [Alphaproteobacteria bacterium]|nr:hypothetical protein [Alphaproteobacteria bacterium]
MTLVAKGLKKSDVPSSGGTLATIAGSGGSKLPVQILDFTQDVTGNISVPDTNLYGYFKINMGSHNIDGAGVACFTNDNVFDVDISGSGTINSNADFTFDTSGSGTTADISSKGIDIAVTNGASFYTSFSTTITQGNSGYSGNQSGGNWNVIRENAGSGTGTWTATVLDTTTNLTGTCRGKSLTVKKNGSSVVSITNATQSWGPIACVQGDVIVWTTSAGIGGGGTINRSQSWSWSGSPKIGYSANTGGGTSGAFNAKQIAITNNNTTNLDLTLQSGTTGISTDTTVASGANLSLTGSGSTISTSTWALVAKITDQTENGVLYSAEPAFNGTNTTTDAAGVPSDGIDLTAFSGTFNRVI